jgi:hypothetical protein
MARDQPEGTEDKSKGTDLFEDYSCGYSTDSHSNVDDRRWHSEERKRAGRWMSVG